MLAINPNLVIGEQEIIIMAGPCSVESVEQMVKVGEVLHKCGIKVIRGGAYKPRTSPRTFQGLGLDGLKIIRSIADEFGFCVVTEALSVEQIPLVNEYADIIQIGSRNMQHFPILWAAGELRKPILLKRGFMNTIEETLFAVEHIMSKGNDRIILCERGIRTFDSETRFTLDLSAIPILKSRCGLPVIADPSHAVGKANLVTPLSLASIAAGADGLLIECHPNPDNALSDGSQSLPLEIMPRFMDQIKKVAIAIGRTVETNDSINK